MARIGAGHGKAARQAQVYRRSRTCPREATKPLPPPPPCIMKSPFQLLGQGECKADTELLAVNAFTPMDDAVHAAMGGQRAR